MQAFRVAKSLSLERTLGRFAPKASNPEVCLCRLSFQYPNLSVGLSGDAMDSHLQSSPDAYGSGASIGNGNGKRAVPIF
jgi:hypothetical protein